MHFIPPLSFSFLFENVGGMITSIIFALCTFGLTLVKCRHTPEYYCLGSNVSFLTLHVTLDKLVIFLHITFSFLKWEQWKGFFQQDSYEDGKS